MPRRHAVLAAATVVLPALATGAEHRIPELAAAPFVTRLAPAAPAPARVRPELRLVWVDPVGAAAGSEAVVKSEVGRLLAEMGLRSSFRRGEASELARPGELRVIFLDRPSPGAHGAPVLGATPARFLGERFVWVHVPSVRAAAGVSARAGQNLDLLAQRRYGIAAARVIAHEVVHALAPSVPHGSGLMSARLDVRMLTAARIRVDPELGIAVRAGLEGALPLEGPADAMLAAQSRPVGGR